jgi:hypothetical protein
VGKFANIFCFAIVYLPIGECREEIRQYFLFRHSIFANWRMSARYLPIGEKLVDIRQLAKSTIGENEYWRKENTPKL